ncbi:RNA polymerase II C-terminal domain phosphatase-like 1 isoform X4 [Glycine soja]|uniref:protein-serine/threonine phosphatase n=1 Tax=Glycine soja TaxID=3848 RepID=A0A445GQJ2_GLYSO|nr:RNA polymerase II C-terminal domain phosphatase-like 1 isoform X4 [Glycine soja]RZB63518.1 RNA polymerase II C-terminal domain phosphatase-like 1 isoform C [Glycine soja]
MKRSMVYHGEMEVGEVEIYPEEKKNIDLKEIRISHFSQPSERCPPLAVLHTITSFGICFKMESSTSQTRQQQDVLFHLHSSCIRENKTAVMPLRGEEIHLVAMYSRNNDRPCFWGFIVASGLYNSCLTMLNLRCLGIVFDLDETLVVANTMRSFEDKIEVLHRKMNSEVNPQRISAMQAEIKRYLDDKNILKEYAENDQVVDNGKVIKIQSEIVPALSDSHQPIVRPLIRLQEKNIILTRINPQIRDTSVLVRLRPAWEDLRSYLTARGRKRFEVFVCTMAERDYALEMWRLLDPELNLINSKELIDRIVCVKSGLKKSLFNVFQNGLCHLKMALVIDDRLKVWDEKDQPQVHVVPAFAPYYAPQAEASNAVPTLCLARSVACNVRGGFFKDFDDGLLQKIPLIAYEDDIKDIPSPPDVSNYLVSEDDASASNGNKNLLLFDGMADAEVERRLKVHHRDDHSRLSQSLSSYHSFPGDDIPLSGSSYSNRDFDSESGRSLFHADITTGVLQEIALKCGTKVEFLSSLVANTALQFSIEAWFAGKKVGEGFGRTRREAQNKAAECSIKQLADIYMSHTKDDSGSTYGDVSGFHGSNNNGFVSSGNSLGNQLLPKESVSFSTSSDSSRVSDPRLEVSKRSTDSISALKEFCMMEGLAANFQSSPAPASTHFAQKDEVHAQVEIDGQIFGKGFGLTWEEAKMQAAKKALESLRTMFNQGTRKRHGSPRSMQGLANKRLKQEYPRTLQRIPYSARYPRNAPLVP